MAAKKKHNKILEKVDRQSDFYIRSNPDKLTIEELAEATGLTEVVVERIVEDEKVKVEKEQKRLAASSKEKKKRPESPFSQALGRKERKGQYVATVMTKSAAQIADEARKSSAKLKNDTRFLHNPKG